MLSDAFKDEIRFHLSKVSRPIKITLCIDQSEKSNAVRELLEEIASLNDRVELAIHGAPHKRVPSFCLSSPETTSPVGITFAGLPAGHEFSSFVLALLHVGGHPPLLEKSVVEQIQSISRPLNFETFYSASCHNCPDVVQALNVMAALNPHITHTAIDGAAFPTEADERDVRAVPAVFLNGEPFAVGHTDLESIMAQVLPQKSAQTLNVRDPYDMLVVGGGPAGCAAAIYGSRKGLRTAIATETVGGQMLETASIENFISVKSTDGKALSASLREHIGAYKIDVIASARAIGLIKGDEIIGIELSNRETLNARTVIVATGARWKSLGVPGEDFYRNKGVAYCPHCDGPLFAGKHVAVVGGGNSGVEAAIDLAHIAAHVTLLEFADHLPADGVLKKRMLSLPNVSVHLSAQTTEIRGDGKKVSGLVYQERHTGARVEVSVDGVFVQVGQNRVRSGCVGRST